MWRIVFSNGNWWVTTEVYCCGCYDTLRQAKDRCDNLNRKSYAQ